MGVPPPPGFPALDLELHPKSILLFVVKNVNSIHPCHTSIFILPLGGEHVKDDVYFQNSLPKNKQLDPDLCLK